MRDKLITAGIKNLKTFGYPKVNAENIIADPLYSAFFKSMLEENKGHGEDIDKAIDGILTEIAERAK